MSERTVTIGFHERLSETFTEDTFHAGSHHVGDNIIGEPDPSFLKNKHNGAPAGPERLFGTPRFTNIPVPMGTGLS